MDINSLTVIVGSVTAFFSVITGYMVNRNTNAINDRKQLAEEQAKLREDLWTEMKDLRKEVDIWRDRSLKLEDEIHEWREKYLILEIEYRVAINRITELENELKRLRGDQNEMA